MNVVSTAGPARRTRRIKAGVADAIRGDDTRLRAFEEEVTNAVSLPADARVIGEPVIVTQIRYPELRRAGFLATCERDGRSHCRQLTVPAKQSRSGVTPPKNETHVDHIVPKAKGATGLRRMGRCCAVAAISKSPTNDGYQQLH